MTREEFQEEINNYHDLINLCNGYGLSSCDDIYDDSEIDDYINDKLLEGYVIDNSWYDLKDILNNIPTGYAYYQVNGYAGLDGIYGLDDYDFADWKDEVYDEMDGNGLFDDDEYAGEEEYIASPEPVDTAPIEDEPLSMDELMSATQVQISTISAKPKEPAQVEMEIDAFIGVTATVKGG